MNSSSALARLANLPVVVVVLILTMLSPLPRANAAGEYTFEVAAFEAAQRAGRPILVDVSAPWCPTCFVQGLTLRGLLAQQRYAGLVVFHVDFDSRKDVLRQLRVQQQATLIVFKGMNEVGRSTGDPVAAHIAALLDRTIS